MSHLFVKWNSLGGAMSLIKESTSVGGCILEPQHKPTTVSVWVSFFFSIFFVSIFNYKEEVIQKQ